MKILAIETSCDETSAAIVQDGVRVFGLKIASQVDLHAVTGGVVPEVAAREHPLKIWPVIEETLAEAKMSLSEVDAIAATSGPGLLPALLTGYLTGRTVAEALQKPFVPVQHVLGHVYANFLERGKVEFPFVCLTVSGGHNQLMLFRDYFDFEILGATRDDAAGEAFDKVAKLLGLGYPGGPIVSAKAEKGRAGAVVLPYPWVNEIKRREGWDKKNFEFSFSGLKSAVRRLVVERGELDEQFVCDVCYAFQEVVCEVLASKLIEAAKKFGAKEVHLAGGVSANKFLRKRVEEKIDAEQVSVVFRVPERFIYCTDNAAMISSVAFFQIQEGVLPKIFDAEPNLDLDLFYKKSKLTK